MNSNKFLSDEERSSLEDFLLKRIESDTRNATMLLVGLHSGARAQEVLNLGWDDINIKTGEIFIKSLKDGNPRTIVLPKSVRYSLELLKNICPNKPFDISYKRLFEIWNDYKPSKTKTFMCLRHSFAIRAYQRTKDIKFVQMALGHKSITNTMIYLDYEYSSKQFIKLMNVK